MYVLYISSSYLQDIGLRNAEEFLISPSLEKFNTIPKPQRISLIKEAIKVRNLLLKIVYICEAGQGKYESFWYNS